MGGQQREPLLLLPANEWARGRRQRMQAPLELEREGWEERLGT